MVIFFKNFSNEISSILLKKQSHLVVKNSNNTFNNFWADSGLWDYALAKLLENLLIKLIASCFTVFGLVSLVEAVSFRFSRINISTFKNNYNILLISGFKLFSIFILFITILVAFIVYLI